MVGEAEVAVVDGDIGKSTSERAVVEEHKKLNEGVCSKTR